MTTLESRLADALSAGAAQVAPAPDLFSRVQSSVEADRARRRTRRRSLAYGALTIVGLASLVFVTTERRQGRLLMRWWILELIATALLIAIALWLGPFIKRFGRSYAADVFRASPRTGKSFIVLTDIVYYLIFTAYILFTTSVAPRLGWRQSVTATQIQFELARFGGILLIIGVLHGLNLVLMPVLGRLFSLNRRLDSNAPPEQ
ncbi:MAG TPA: hypothetical protein VJ935_06930 [Acidimicrobiia bacterium]|nr:hypothetical protein [Acidimicrobiia bacterium]